MRICVGADMGTGVITSTCIGADIGVNVHTCMYTYVNGSRYRCGYMQGLIWV